MFGIQDDIRRNVPLDRPARPLAGDHHFTQIDHLFLGTPRPLLRNRDLCCGNSDGGRRLDGGQGGERQRKKGHENSGFVGEIVCPLTREQRKSVAYLNE